MFSILFINLLTKSIKVNSVQKSPTLVEQETFFANVNSVQECPTSVEHGHLYFCNHLQQLKFLSLLCFWGKDTLW